VNLTQLLTFEVTDKCNLGAEHTRCPNMSPDRFPAARRMFGTMSDATIVETARAAYLDHGFEGLIAWHYYCEPLCDAGRMWELMGAIRDRVPQARFLLWTNGLLIPKPPSSRLAKFRQFERIVITDYSKRDLAPLLAALPQARVFPARLDARLDPPPTPPSSRPCLRPFVELILDFYGNVHACCFDWRGAIGLGNVTMDPFPAILRRWRILRERIGGRQMRPEAPETCQRCWARQDGLMGIDERIVARALDWRQERLPVPRGLAVCFPACRTPPQRLADHFRWNGQFYEESGAQVMVVVDADDPQPELPDYAVALRSPRRPVFSIAATKNQAIRAALSAGFATIVATDLDVSFPPDAWGRLIAPQPGTAIIPLYRMAAGYEQRETQYVEAPRATGTIAMRAEDWRLVEYDERCTGYGGEDGVMMADLTQAGIAKDRTGHVDHIAHQAGTDQVEPFLGGSRSDHWGRAEGYCPDTLRENCQILRERHR
jgi:hypothetical protein